jgi:Ca-activated chloride channel family protein
VGFVALAALALTLWVTTSAAQESEVTLQLASLSADDWPDGKAVVTVVDGAGRTVPGLDATSFEATLGGERLPVVEARQGVDSSLPISVLLAIDTSGSMEGGALDQAKAAAVRFLQSLGPQDSVAILTFDDTVELVQPFTQDRALAETAINNLTAGGGTALYQATAESARLASEQSGARKAVVLLSDGLDNGSPVPRDEAIISARTANLPIFVIGLGADLDFGYLAELSELTGGSFAETPSPEGLDQLFQTVAEKLRGQYVLTLDGAAIEAPRDAATVLRVSAIVDNQVITTERAVCLQSVCATLRNVVAGERIQDARTIAVDVVASEAVLSVALVLDGEPLSEVESPPYEFTFDPSSAGKGDHALGVRVTTADGETTAGVLEIKTGAPSSLLSGLLLPGLIVAAAAAVVVVLVVLFFRLRGGGAGEPAPEPDPEPQPPEKQPIPIPTRKRERDGAPLWPEEPEPSEPQPSAQPGYLRIVSGPSSGTEFAVGASPVSIGTGHRCRIKLEDPEGEQIGPEHARAWVRDGHLMLHELRRLSALGPMGGRWAILVPGDNFSIGPYTFQFSLEQAPVQQAPAPGPVPNILREHTEAPPQTPQQDPPGQSAPVVDLFMPKEGTTPPQPPAPPATGPFSNDPQPQEPDTRAASGE